MQALDVPEGSPASVAGLSSPTRPLPARQLDQQLACSILRPLRAALLQSLSSIEAVLGSTEAFDARDDVLSRLQALRDGSGELLDGMASSQMPDLLSAAAAPAKPSALLHPGAQDLSSLIANPTKQIKLIVFDLDGVLVSSRELHYQALNRALEAVDRKYMVGLDEHLARYDGLPTSVKLDMLSREKGLPENLHAKVWAGKQRYTWEIIDKEYMYDERIRDVLRELKAMGFMLYCASNATHNTVKMILLRRGFMEFIDFFISNEDVARPKPSPDIYMRCITRAKVTPRETVVVEDSHHGRKAALDAGANLAPVNEPADVKLDYILATISKISDRVMASSSEVKWNGETNIVIPLCGYGAPYKRAGYTFPKPLIDVGGMPMIQKVVENLNINGHFIFIILKAHSEQFQLEHLLKLIVPDSRIVVVDEPPNGPLLTVLHVKQWIDNSVPLVIANGQQFMEWDSNGFMYAMSADGVDGGISTHESTHPKWSFVQLDEHGYVTKMCEKVPISNVASTGIYHWRSGELFVRYAEQTIADAGSHEDQFYISEVYNTAVQDGCKIRIKPVEKFFGLGLPEELQQYMAHSRSGSAEAEN